MRRRLSEWTGRLPCDPGYLLVGGGLAAFLVYEELLRPARLPVEIMLLGLVFGSLNALPALGLVLIYRTNRIINFAQGELGGFAAVIAAELIFYKGWPTLAAFAVALIAAGCTGWLVERLVVRGFFNAPRLILTVATIGVAQVLAAEQLLTPSYFGTQTTFFTALPAPIEAHFSVGVASFDGAAIVTLIVAPLLALALFAGLRFTMIGSAIRAAAEDSSRARSLGIPVKRLSTLVWVVSAVVAGMAALLAGHVQGFAFGSLPGPGLLMRILAPAAIARFDNLGVTFAAALALGVVDQGVLFNTGSDSGVELTLFIVILVALLVRGSSRGRRALAEGSTFALLREVRPIPRRLLNLPEVRLLRWAPMTLAAAGLVIVPQLLSPSQVEQAQTFLIYSMVGLSLVVLSGYAGQISLGQWALAGVGAFAAGRFFTALQGHPVVDDFFVALIFAGVVGAVVCALVALPALRIGGYMLAVVTLAFAVAADASLFQLDIVQLPPVLPRPSLFGRFNTFDEKTFYYVALAIFAISFAAVVNFRRGRRGRALVAMRDNESAGAALGFTPLRAKLAAFLLSGFIAAVAGGLFAFQNTALGSGASSSKAFLPEIGVFLFAIVVFGGLGSPVGATLGAATIIGMQTLATDLNISGLQYLAGGLGIILLLYIAPGGLGQLVYDARDAMVRAIAARHAGTASVPPPAAPGPDGGVPVTAVVGGGR
jgi:branched-chain amino acid transport system permease protein